MPCRVGITTNPQQRRVQWEGRVVGLKNWRTHGSHLSKEDAQDEEDRLVYDCNSNGSRGTCHGRAGGGDPKGQGWTVYSFDYTRER